MTAAPTGFTARSAGSRPLRVGPVLDRLRRRADTLVSGVVLNRDGRRPVVLRKAFFDVAHLATPVVRVDREGGSFYLSTRDRVVSRVTFSEGVYDEHVMAAAVRTLAEHGHPIDGRVFVDVGANIGTSTVPALTRYGAATGLAIEPEPGNYKLLRCNLIANDLEDRVTTVMGAASDTRGAGRLALSPSNSGDHRVTGAAGAGAAVDVELFRLDDVLAEQAIAPDDIGVVWIDTQGHEGLVLKGAPRLLASPTPIICEYWPYGLRLAGDLELFHDLVAAHFDTVVDVRDGRPGRMRTLPASQVADLESAYPDQTFTDLILLSADRAPSASP